MRTFQMPIMPSNWNDQEKTFWRMLREALEALAAEIKLSDFSADVNNRLSNIDKDINTSDENIESLLERINSFKAAPVVDRLPTPYPDQIGKLVYLKGNTSDGLYVCIKQNNIYSFKQIDLYSPTPTPTPTPDPPTPVEKYIYYNGMYATGTEWVKNYFPRDNYTGSAFVDLDNSASIGYMKLYVSGYKGNRVSFNCHVATSDKIRIPANAAGLRVTAYGRNGNGYINFGLLPDGALSSVDTSSGGIMSGYLSLDGSSQTVSIPISSDMRGSTDYRILVNMRGSQGSNDLTQKEIRVTKVEFYT